MERYTRSEFAVAAAYYLGVSRTFLAEKSKGHGGSQSWQIGRTVSGWFPELTDFVAEALAADFDLGLVLNFPSSRMGEPDLDAFLMAYDHLAADQLRRVGIVRTIQQLQQVYDRAAEHALTPADLSAAICTAYAWKEEFRLNAARNNLPARRHPAAQDSLR